MTPRSLAGALGLIACCACVGGEAGAHVISDKEVLVLRALPPSLVAELRAESLPDSATGLCGANRGGWQAIGAQRGALLLLASAASRSDSAGAEQAWRSLDAVFRRQGPDGRIPAAPEARIAGGDTMAMVDWAGEACRALIAVTNGPLRKRFQFRYSLLLPKLEKLVRALEPSAEARAREQARDAAALLAEAQLFLLADGIYHDAAFGAAGQRAIAAARTLQRADGAFLVRGRTASPGQQALCLQRLQSITQYFPAPSLESALARGATWLGRSAVRERRRLGEADRREVALTLALVGERGGDAEVRAAATMLENRR
jgi:hypothetical protein